MCALGGILQHWAHSHIALSCNVQAQPGWPLARTVAGLKRMLGCWLGRVRGRKHNALCRDAIWRTGKVFLCVFFLHSCGLRYALLPPRHCVVLREGLVMLVPLFCTRRLCCRH